MNRGSGSWSAARRLSGALVVAVGLLAGGCASTKLGAANDLGEAGSRSSAKLVTAAAAVEDGFALAIDQDALLQPLQDSTTPPPGVCSFVGRLTPVATPISAAAPPSPAIARIEQALAARRLLAMALGKTYAGWNALARYDASGQVSAGVGGVFDAANTLRNTEGLAPIPSAVGSIAGAAAGGLAGHAQLAKLKAASVQLRIALAGYREALVKGQGATVSAMKNTIGEQYALTIALWQRGYLSARPLVTSVGETSGLGVPVDDKATMTAADEGLCNAVRAYLETRRNSQEAGVARDYQTQIDTVDALIAAHRDFEKDAPLNLERVAALVDQLNTFATGLSGRK